MKDHASRIELALGLLSGGNESVADDEPALAFGPAHDPGLGRPMPPEVGGPFLHVLVAIRVVGQAWRSAGPVANHGGAGVDEVLNFLEQSWRHGRDGR